MPEIRQLDPHVADLIAAGEVVERPASVVKELVENSIDAGAGTVTVEIQNGGMSLIRITDDGCGIPAGEVETAFLRHATSKIRTEYDLEAIGTLGFRGEALAAVAAVARVEVITRTAEAALGVALSLEGGAVKSREETGCPKGTTMLVRDLFFNTPARLKFMKKDSAEGAAVFAAVQHLAMAHPEVSVKFIRDGKQELLTPGDGVLKSALYSVLGRDMALGFLGVKGSGEDMAVEGFVTLPTCCRGTRGTQHFFVNGRYIKSRTMTAAVEEAYKNTRMVGKFPGCVLHLTTRLSGVDVNVHPTKQEVKFTSDRKVFDTIYYAVRAALEVDHTRPQVQVTGGKPAAAADRAEAKTWTPAPRETAPVRPGGALPLHDITNRRAAVQPPARKEPESLARGELRGVGGWVVPSAPAPKPEQKEASPAPERTETPEVKTSKVPEGAAAALVPEEETPWRMVGEVLHTYIIVEQGDKVLFIDKHAAHERMNFDRLKAENYQPMVQALLTPVVFTPPAEEGAALLENRALLERFGFETEDFGGGAILVRRCPYDVDAAEVENTLGEIASKLLATGRADPDGARDALMHTMACKAAIKGGQKNGSEELRRVAEAVMKGEVKYCPHGRPVAIEMTRGQLEKEFKRT